MFLTMFVGAKTALKLALWFSILRARKQERIVGRAEEKIKEEFAKSSPSPYKIGRAEERKELAEENWDKWDERKKKVQDTKDKLKLSPIAYFMSLADSLTLTALTLHYNGIDITPLVKSTAISIARGIGLMAV